MLIFADGQNNQGGNAILQATIAKGAGTRIVVVAMAPVANLATLQAVASPGDFYLATRPADMLRFLSELGCTVCPNPTPVPEPSSTPMTGPELGDAPDSSNHFGNQMTAYIPLNGPGSVTAQFPTVFDAITGVPVGPMHLLPRQDILLGLNVSGEVDADLLPDEDTFENIYPPEDGSDRDLFDDGVKFPISMTHCLTTTLSYTLTAVAGPNTRYVNGWFDFNRDGDWSDTISCGNGIVASEWAIQNQVHNLAAGVHAVQSPAFRVYDPNFPDEQMWMRLSVSEQTAPSSGGNPDGRGPDLAYAVGETEDYLIGVEDTGYQPGAEPETIGEGVMAFFYDVLRGIGIMPQPQPRDDVTSRGVDPARRPAGYVPVVQQAPSANKPQSRDGR